MRFLTSIEDFEENRVKTFGKADHDIKIDTRIYASSSRYP
jgi:hypothetical protein